jgi:peroxiredoxin
MLGGFILRIRRRPYRTFLATLMLGLGLTGACRSTSAEASAMDLDGRPVAPLRQDGSSAVVFLFVRTDCPIANRYAPDFRRLQERFSPKGVVFWLVYPDPAESPEMIRRHMKEYGYNFGALRDPKHELVRLSRATVTPEAAVFVPGRSPLVPVYLGRIDALTAVLSGKPVPRASGDAVGCFIPDL